MKEQYILNWFTGLEFLQEIFFLQLIALPSDVVSKSGSSESSKFIVFVDGGVVGGKQNLLREIESWFNAKDGELELVDSPFVLPGAEACKNDWSLIPEIWEKMNRNSIDRHSYVLAIGGGAFLDMVGFAASTAHRGVRLVRVPTTSLSQGDGGVGVKKNGINYFARRIGLVHSLFHLLL